MPQPRQHDDFKVLFEAYYVRLVEFAWRIVNCEEIARDLVQDVFLKIIEDPAVLPQEDKMKSYLYSMVKNRALNHLRHRSIAGRHHQNMKSCSVVEDDALDALIYAEALYHLHYAIEALPTACQKVCRLTYLQEASNQEAAKHSRLSVNTIKTQKRRAVTLLRKQLLPVFRTARLFFFFF